MSENWMVRDFQPLTSRSEHAPGEQVDSSEGASARSSCVLRFGPTVVCGGIQSLSRTQVHEAYNKVPMPESVPQEEEHGPPDLVHEQSTPPGETASPPGETAPPPGETAPPPGEAEQVEPPPPGEIAESRKTEQRPSTQERVTLTQEGKGSPLEAGPHQLRRTKSAPASLAAKERPPPVVEPPVDAEVPESIVILVTLKLKPLVQLKLQAGKQAAPVSKGQDPPASVWEVFDVLEVSSSSSSKKNPIKFVGDLFSNIPDPEQKGLLQTMVSQALFPAISADPATVTEPATTPLSQPWLDFCLPGVRTDEDLENLSIGTGPLAVPFSWDVLHSYVRLVIVRLSGSGGRRTRTTSMTAEGGVWGPVLQIQ